MKRILFVLSLTVLILTTCDDQAETIKSIIIQDTNPDYAVRFSAIQQNYIFIALVAEKIMPATPDLNAYLSSTYSIYEAGNSPTIRADLYSSFPGTYWTGEGNFWVVLLVFDKSLEYVKECYLTKERQNFYGKETYLRNIDFSPPVLINYYVGDTLKDIIAQL